MTVPMRTRVITTPLYLELDSWFAREEALAVLEAYSTLLVCGCGVHRRAGLACAACGRDPAPEEIDQEEETLPPR